MANIKSAIKRAELNVKQNEKNSAQKSAMRTAIKAFEANPSEELYRAASSAIDKAETKGLIHKNKASRDKARLAAKTWLIFNCIQNELFGAFFVHIFLEVNHENCYYRIFRIR